MVSIDTLRADRLGAYGYRAGRTPRLDALAARSVVFEEAVAAAPITAPSHATIFTGLYPPEHGLRSNGAFHLAEEHVTLAEALRGAGFRTGAAIGAFPLASSSGLGQGFDVYDEHLGDGDEPERPASAVTDAALRVLAQIHPPGQASPPRFFLFVHYYDPHAAYAPPPDIRLPDPYDGEIAYVDRELGRLLDALPADTSIIVLADHGEGLGDHGEEGHAVFVYQSTLHVPLLVAHAGLEARRAPAPVSLADVAPTVLDLLGLPPPGRTSGATLVGPATGRELPPRPLFFESRMPELEFRWAPLEGIRLGERKLVRAPRPELYDLAADPAESANLWSPDAGAELETALDALAASRWPGGGSLATAVTSPEELEKLEALGYVGAGATSGARAEAPDPKDRVEQLRRMTQAVARLEAGDLVEAERLYRAAYAEEPASPVLAKGLARSLAEQGQLEEAAAILARAIPDTQGPLRAQLLVDRAAIAIQRGDPGSAATDAGLALELSGSSLKAALLLAQALEQEGRATEALAVLGNVSVTLAQDADPLVARAEVLLRAGRGDEARADLEAALEREPGHGRAHYDLGLALLRGERQEEATSHLVAAHDALGDGPFRAGSDPEARYVLAVALSRTGRASEATAMLRLLAEESPENAAVWNALGTAIARGGDPAAAVGSFERAAALAPGNRSYVENLEQARGYAEAPPEAPADPRRASPR